MMDNNISNKEISRLWKQISGRLSDSDFGKIETKNLKNELEALDNRLKYGQFKITNFLGYNTFAFPRRTNEFLENVERWVEQASVWKQVLESIGLENVKSVVDLGVGYVPKIELALYKLGFDGVVQTFDIDQKARGSVESFMRLFDDCKYKIESKEDFFSDEIVETDLIVANHVVDDFLMNKYVNKNSMKLEEVYKNEKVYSQISKKILSDSSGMVEEFVSSFADRVNKVLKNNGVILMNSYMGILEEAMELDDWSKYCEEISEMIADKLITMDYVSENESVAKIVGAVEAKYFNRHGLLVLRKK